MDILAIEAFLTEDQFEKLVGGKNLSVAQREALRKYYNLPCNEELLARITFWQHYAVAALQKVRGNPLL